MIRLGTRRSGRVAFISDSPFRRVDPRTKLLLSLGDFPCDHVSTSEADDFHADLRHLSGLGPSADRSWPSGMAIEMGAAGSFLH